MELLKIIKENYTNSQKETPAILLLDRIKSKCDPIFIKKINKKTPKKSHPLSRFLYVFINKGNSGETFILNC